MSIEVAVKSIPAIAGCYKRGLQAMGANARFVRPADTRKCDGSVALDECLAEREPDASRWDYAIGYGAKVYFAEVHPAQTGELSRMEAKSKWLRAFLKVEGAALAALHADSVLHWIPSGKVALIGNYKFRLAQAKLVVTNPLNLP